MRYRKEINIGGNPFGSLTGIILGIVFLVLLFYLTRFIFNILWWLSPLLFIASLVLDHKVFLGYVKWVAALFRSNVLSGIGATVLSVLLFPILATFLFGRALFRKKIRDAEKKYQQQQQGELIDFEEVTDEHTLELPPLEKKIKEPKKGNEYDQFFNGN